MHLPHHDNESLPKSGGSERQNQASRPEKAVPEDETGHQGYAKWPFPSERASEQADEQVTERANNQVSEQLNKQVSEQPSKQVSEQSNGQPIEQPSEQPGGQTPRLILELGSRKLAILDHLHQNAPVVISIQKLSKILGIPNSTLRRHLSQLKNADFITSRAYHQGELQGTEFGVNHIKCRPVLQYLSGEQPNEQEIEQPFRRANERAIERASPLDRKIDLPEKQKENQSIADGDVSKAGRPLNWLDGISSEIYLERWPFLEKEGFRKYNLVISMDKYHLEHPPTEPLDVQLVIDGLDYANWELKKGRVLKKGIPTHKYLFGAIKLSGTFRRPDDYISVKEYNLQKRIKDLERLENLKNLADEKKREKITAAANEWINRLSSDDKERILKIMQETGRDDPDAPRFSILKQYFFTDVYPKLKGPDASPSGPKTPSS